MVSSMHLWLLEDNIFGVQSIFGVVLFCEHMGEAHQPPLEVFLRRLLDFGLSDEADVWSMIPQFIEKFELTASFFWSGFSTFLCETSLIVLVTKMPSRQFFDDKPQLAFWALITLTFFIPDHCVRNYLCWLLSGF